MIKTHVFEIYADFDGKVNERDLGWCMMPEIPIDKKVPQENDPPAVPRFIKINGERYGIAGFSFELQLSQDANAYIPGEVRNIPTADLILFVQKVVVNQSAPRGPALVRAPGHALKELELQVPVPGKKN